MRNERQEYIRKLEEMTNCDVYILFTASGEQMYLVSGDFLPLFTESIFVRRNGRRRNAILIMETNGGDPTTAMAIVKQLREHYVTIYGYAFNRCFSAGTIGMFATDKIYMSRYALLSPVDIQLFIGEGEEYKPLIANFNAYIERRADEKEMEYAAAYPAEYIKVITATRYAMQTIYPNFAKHCKEKYLESTWGYFNGGAGMHSTKVSRKQAIQLGLMIRKMPDDVEELLYSIIDSYIKATNMMVASLSELEVKDAYFETLGLTYVHYAKYQQQFAKDDKDKEDVSKEESGVSKKDSASRVAEDKYCIEIGWKKEE